MLGGEISGTVKMLRYLSKEKFKIIALTNWSSETFPVALKDLNFKIIFRNCSLRRRKTRKPFDKIYQLTINNII